MATNESQKVPIAIEEEMKSSFMDYAMSVIVSRALPDARDGLKPVHRRIMYAMLREGLLPSRRYSKCAGIVGEVLKKYHPHGDSAVYDALVRLAQPWNLRYPLVDGQGNFGSIDGDPAAAYRYTEARLEKLAEDLLADIDKETVDWQPNFDDQEVEPTVLPTRVPNLLLNGASGIAVGMATNIPPHNLRELIDGTVALLDDPSLDSLALMQYIPGPDFPTGASIFGREGIRAAYATGRGSLVVRAKMHTEEHPKTGRDTIVVDEIPYQLNKTRLIEKIAELVKDKKIEGISDLRDESDRDGMRIVIELRKDAVSAVVMNNLYKLTPLQSSFGVMLLAIVDSQPRILTLKDALQRFIEHRREVVTRRTVFELKEARSRKEIVEGLGVSVFDIDAVIALIRGSADPEEAREKLMAHDFHSLDKFLERAGRPAHELEAARATRPYRLSERQAQAILDMRLQRLTGLEVEKLAAEFAELSEAILRLEAILADEGRLVAVIKEELAAIRAQYSDERRTVIVDDEGEIPIEELIAEEDMVVTLTHGGYVKRNPVTAYRSQQRGGRGVSGAQTPDEDFVAELFVASTHDHLLIITDRGRAYAKRVFHLPQAARTARGKALVNLLELQDGEKVVTMRPIKAFEDGRFVVMATRRGVVKKTELPAFANIRATGIIALRIDEDDSLVAVDFTGGDSDVLLATRGGYAVRFSEKKVRSMGRDARGVRGIALRADDGLVGMAVVAKDDARTLLTVCERGYGKRTPLPEYPQKGRGGKGVITIKTSDRNGPVVAVRVVSTEDHLMMITDRGKIIRMPVGGIPEIGRNTQGVRLIRLEEGEAVRGVERLAEPEDDTREATAPELDEAEIEAARREDADSKAAPEDGTDDEGGDDEDEGNGHGEDA